MSIADVLANLNKEVEQKEPAKETEELTEEPLDLTKVQESLEEEGVTEEMCEKAFEEELESLDERKALKPIFPKAPEKLPSGRSMVAVANWIKNSCNWPIVFPRKWPTIFPTFN